MDINDLIQKISQPDVDIDSFVQLAINDAQIRDAIVHQMLTHPHIMMYYHCYYVVSQASQDRPDLFLQYWDDMVSLLSHANSYHRDFGLVILANITAVDAQERFPEIFDAYFAHINDKKFMTAQCCVQNSQKIIHHKPALRDRILELLLDIDHRCVYPEKQKALLKCEVLEILDGIYRDVKNSTVIDRFIKAQVSSISPKTKKKAKVMVDKYSL